MIYFAATQIPIGNFTVGMLYAFILYRVRLADSLYSLVERYFEYRMVEFHLDRIADIAGREERSSKVHVRFQMAGTIEACGLWFSYPGMEGRAILEGLSFIVPNGSLFALFGPSGAGKSTLLNVLAGFLTPTRGHVLIDGRVVSQVTMRTFRANTSAVFQDDTIFEGTVVENITFFQSSPDENAVVAAAQAACIDDEVATWPMGYRTVLGGARPALSAGQQQRILMARALYGAPTLLLLDEATSSCESELQARIFNNIRERGITCIYATHDERLLEYAEGMVRWEKSGVTIIPKGVQDAP